MDLSLPSFSIHLSSSSTTSGAKSCSSNGSSSSSYDCSDTQCSSLLRTLDSLADTSIKLRSKYSGKDNINNRDLQKGCSSVGLTSSLCSPTKQHKSKFKTKQHRLLSRSASNKEDNICENTVSNTNSPSPSFPSSSGSKLSISLSSPLLCESHTMESNAADFCLALTLQSPSSVLSHPGEALSLSEAKESQSLVEGEAVPDSTVINRAINIMSDAEVQQDKQTHTLEKDVSDSILVLEADKTRIEFAQKKVMPISPSMSPIQLAHAARCSETIPLALIPVDGNECEDEFVTELPSTSSFHADEARASRGLDSLQASSPIEQRHGETCIFNSTLRNLNGMVRETNNDSSQLKNSFFVDEEEPNWTAPNPASSLSILRSPTSKLPLHPTNHSIPTSSLLDDRNKTILVTSDVYNAPQRNNTAKIMTSQRGQFYSKTKEQKDVHLRESIDDDFAKHKASLRYQSQGPERKRNHLQSSEDKSWVKTVRAIATPETNKNNVVKSAERLSVNSIRSYYINKIQEMEAKHQKQLSNIKAHQFIGRHKSHDLKREQYRQKCVSAAGERPALETKKAKRANLKDSCQQTDLLPEVEVVVNADPSDQMNQSSKRGLQNQISKMVSDNLFKEQLVQRLTEQLKATTIELHSARRELQSKLNTSSGSANTQHVDPLNHHKLQRSLEVSQVKSIQLQNQVDNLQFENDSLKIQLSSVTSRSEGSHLIERYSSLSRKICELEQRAIRREEEIQSKINEIQRKTASENQRLQTLHEEEMREKNEKLTVLKTKLDCLMKK